ncbi:MAG: hypothetical protein FWE37_03570 [Spirochaetaceae bacterium]|nr:hypothetical protein [Spirochaetaceae bacterium]
MKKIITTLLLVAFALTMTACASTRDRRNFNTLDRELTARQALFLSSGGLVTNPHYMQSFLLQNAAKEASRISDYQIAINLLLRAFVELEAAINNLPNSNTLPLISLDAQELLRELERAQREFSR